MPIINLVYEAPEGWKPGANTLLYLPMTEDFSDVTGNGYNGTISSGSFSFIQDGNTTVAQNNTTSSYVTIPNFTINISTGCTISIWWKFTSLANFMGMIDIYSSDAMARVQRGGSNMNYGVHINVAGGTGIYQIQISADTWYHTAVVYGSDGIKLYTNGVLSGTGNKFNSNQTSNWHRLGAAPNISGGTRRLSNYIIENKARTAQEVSDYYNQTKANYGIS